MSKELENLRELFETLSADVLSSFDPSATHDTQYNRRTYVRTFFCLVEGFTSGMKPVALMAAKRNGHRFTRAQRALLHQESYELTNKGTAKAQLKFLRVADNVRFTISCFAKGFLSDFTLDVSDKGWHAFREAIKIRNRITHPKTSSDLEISDEDLTTVMKAEGWYRVSTTALLNHVEL